MALSVATVWEVRPATGSDTNGGGFVAGASGTDYSQQTSAQVTYTDLVIDATTNTKLTSAGNPFTSSHVGNIINVTGGTGFTTGRYQVVSVAAGVATMDRAVGTTSSTGGTGKLGGALATISTAAGVMVAGNTCYFTGTYTVTAALVLAFNSNSCTFFIGYGSSRTDGTLANWTTSTNSINLVEFNAASQITFQNIDFSSTAVTPGNGLIAKTTSNSSYITLQNCNVHGFSKGIDGNFSVDWAFCGLVIDHCRIYSSVYGIYNGSPAVAIYNSYIHDNTTAGLLINAGSGSGVTLVSRCVIKSNQVGIDYEAQAGITGNMISIKNCAIINNTSHGISLNVNPAAASIENCIIDSNGGNGILVSGSVRLNVGGSNAFRNNTSGDVSNWTKFSTDITLTGDPFTNRASDDFSLNSTTGAGASCKAIGQPTVFP